MHINGFTNLSDFLKKGRVNRATLYHYLRGKPVFSSQFLKISKILNLDPLVLIEKNHEVPSLNLPEQLKKMIEILLQDKKIAVFLVGSQASGSARQFSDWDIGITRHRTKLSDIEFLDYKAQAEKFSENHVQPIDLLNLDLAPVWFLREMSKPPLFLSGNQLSGQRFMKRWEDCHAE